MSLKLTTINADAAANHIRRYYASTLDVTRKLYERPDVTCRPGCAHCCAILNLVTLPEALVLADHLKATRSPEELAAYRLKLDNYLREHFPKPDPSITRYSHFEKRAPCTLLGEDGLCTAYEARPGVCRFHFAASAPEKCAPAPDGKPQMVAYLNLEPYKMQVFAFATSDHRNLPRVFGPLEVVLWWALIHRVDGAVAYGQALADPANKDRMLDAWLDWTIALETKKPSSNASAENARAPA